MRNILSTTCAIYFALFFSSTVRSQTTLDTTFASQTNFIFANVDKSKVPYGILIDYGMEFTNLNQFNGSAALADSNKCDLRSFYDVYNSLLSSRVNNTVTIFSRQSNLDSTWFNYRQAGRITMMGLYINYSRFADNAANNTITISNNQLYDKYVSGVWQNPYQSERAFVMCPSVEQYAGTSFEVLLPSTLFIKNISTYTFSVDFHDGAGYRAITPGIPVNINYADTGLYKWTYRINISGTNYFCESYIHIIPTGSDGQITLFTNRNKKRFNVG